MQVQVKKSFYQSFGGINFIEDDIEKINFDPLVTETLGSRSLIAKYSYGDLLKNIFYSKLIGGDTLDDLNVLKDQLQDHPMLTIASPDTIEYAFQELIQPVKKEPTTTGKEHFINEHNGFNSLMTRLCRQTRLLKQREKYTMDYDGHIIENNKLDNATTYKYSDGYYPVVCSINKLPVYLQNRNGNTPESYNQKSSIAAALEQCTAQKITVNKFRADACCYEKNTIEYLEENHITYYIRAEQNENLRIALEDETEWQPAVLNHCKVDVCSIEEPIFGQKTFRRIVAYRRKLSNEQATIFDNNGYRYSAIVTSDTQATPLDVIRFYNQRGCQGEHHFKELDYDFSWNKLPFHNFQLNTIYLYATAIAYILFEYVKQKYAGVLDFVNKSMRLKNFILHFVTLTAKWIRTGRQWVLKIFTTKNYEPAFQT
jgi:hypothetical protein